MMEHELGELKLWLWKNFVNGNPEYWAFDNPFPIHLDCGDPQTLGEPCGYAFFKPSRQGRTDVPEEQVLARIRAANAKGDQRGDAPAPLPESMSRDEMLRYYSEYANMVCGEVTVYQKRIRDLQALLQQALEALDTCDGDPNGYKGPVQWHDEQKVDAAIKVLRAALGGSDGEITGEKSKENAVKSTSCGDCSGMETPIPL